MIDITQYRSRIGQYCHRSRSRKYLYRGYFYQENTYNETCGKYTLSSIQSILKLAMFLVLVSPVWQPLPVLLADSSVLQRSCSVQNMATSHSRSLYRVGMMINTSVGKQTGNFWARYVFGNRINVKGIKNLHFNIRKLKNKVDEVKNIIKQESPNIFWLSECDL